MGLSVGPQSFAPVTLKGEVQSADGHQMEGRGDSPLDPLIAALGRAVARSRATLPDETRKDRD